MGLRLKKIGYVLLGLSVSILLLLPVLYMIRSMDRVPGRHYSLVVFMVILPACLIIGSLLSGYLIQPHLKQRSFFRYLLISPGVYLSLAGIASLVVTLAKFFNQPNKIQLIGLFYIALFFVAIMFVEWIVVSFLGTRIGIFLKDKKIRQSHQPASGNP